MRFRWSMLLVPALLLFAGGARADFELPLLFPVPKLVVVPEDAPADLLERLATVDDLTLQVRMRGGNMMPEVTVQRLNRLLPGVTKRIELQGEVKQIHVDQLRRLDRLEVIYRVGPGGLSDQTFNALFALGPVRKFLLLPAAARPEVLARVGRLKFFVPVFELADQPPPKRLVDWVQERRLSRVRFVLPADLDPARVYDLLQFSPLELEVQTVSDRIRPELAAVLEDLRGVGLAVVVDGRLTLQDVKRFVGLERFSLVVDLGDPPGYTPGLPGLLNRVAPPRRGAKNLPNR